LFDRNGNVAVVLRATQDGGDFGRFEERRALIDMDLETQLKLQAYLDGELPEAEAREVAKWLAQDQEAVLLLGELRNTRQAMKGGETLVQLPESREFYWSKIEREIERLEQPQRVEQKRPFIFRLQRFLVPLSGAVALAVVLGVTLLNEGGSSGLGETEVASEDMGAITFRSESEGMTTVWLYNRGDSEFTDELAPDSVEPQ
jgi:anti-sigma factor RsiW